MFLWEVGSSMSALGNIEHRWLLEELEAGKVDLRRRAGRTLFYDEREGEWLTYDDDLDKTVRARDARRRQLAEVWYAGRGRIWQALVDGSLRARKVRADGQLEDIPTSHFKQNVEAEVFNLGEIVWPKRGMLVVAEHAFKQWIRSLTKRGLTSSPTGTRSTHAARDGTQLTQISPNDEFDVLKNLPGGGGKVTERVAKEMLRQLDAEKITIDEFRRLSGPKLSERFGASRTVVEPARVEVLAQLRAKAAQRATPHEKNRKKQKKNN
jgi:hypothetical protein